MITNNHPQQDREKDKKWGEDTVKRLLAELIKRNIPISSNDLLGIFIKYVEELEESLEVIHQLGETMIGLKNVSDDELEVRKSRKKGTKK